MPAESARIPTQVSDQRILVRDLVVSGHLGVTASEQAKAQRIRVNVDLTVRPEHPADDDPAHVVDYRDIVPTIRHLVRTERPKLLETLAERIAQACFHDPRARSARVRIEKLDLYADTSSVGVEVEHTRSD
ncbi:dihydroneopterin aldolase [Limimonas halophila]|uniref:dihydroneopterin aldolase n=1 Tax=Limimonas halophila TaxID=1082479 RepID=A0A1G7LTS4_9PROT|nr:dihydroneopterin aldolase [Limimonas halophila]SDF52968.1 dihydroneopterin aldolase [Limimonas halophila]